MRYIFIYGTYNIYKLIYITYLVHRIVHLAYTYKIIYTYNKLHIFNMED